MRARTGFFCLYILMLALGVSACAKKDVRTAFHGRGPAAGYQLLKDMPTTPQITNFKGLAYVVAERGGVKWANNVSVLVKLPGMVRLDALERISDVVATLSVKEGVGALELPLEGKNIKIENGYTVLPKLGEIKLSTDKLAEILVGRPSIEGGATVSEAFSTDKGIYYINGKFDEMEMSSKDKMPLVYARYSNSDKKHLLYEAMFDDFRTIKGKTFPQHIILRFENPKFLMEIKYQEIVPDPTIHEGLFVR